MSHHEISLEPAVSEVSRLIDWIGRCCAQDGLPDDVAFTMTLALEEAVVNIISHGFADVPQPHEIRVRLDTGGANLIAEVYDNGRPFDPTLAQLPDISQPLDRRDPGGLGIELMRRMVDRIDYSSSDSGNTLRLETPRT
jgi:serine/threonine-protein kinase RsbW